MKVKRLNVDMTLPNDFVWDLPEGRNDYLCVIFKSPSAVRINGTDMPANIGDAILFDKFSPQYYYPTKGEFVHDFIHIDFVNRTEASEYSDIPFNTIISLKDAAGASSILQLIMSEHVSKKNNQKEIEHCLCRAFLLKLKDSILSDDNKHYNVLLKLRTDIHNNPGHEWSIGYMSKQTALCESYLQVLYKKTFGITCMQDVIASRITLAKRLLLCTALSVSEIGEICGYKNTEHFIRQFKTSESASPTAIRKQRFDKK